MKLFDMHTWKIASADADGLVMKPTFSSLGGRLGVTVICLVFVSLLGSGLYRNHQIQSNDLSEHERQQKREIDTLANEMSQDTIDRGLMTQEELDAVAQKSEERLATMRGDLDSSNQTIRIAFWCGIGFFGFLGLLSPTALLWEQLSFSRTIRNELILGRRDSFFWTKKHVYSEGAIQHIFVTAGEQLRRVDNGQHRRTGWMWNVNAQGKGGRGLTIAVDLNPNRPLENRRLPKKAELVASTLSALTGAKLREGYTVTDVESVDQGFFSTKIHRSGTSITTAPKPVRKFHGSIGNVPPEIRDKIVEARRRGETGPVTVRCTQSVDLSPGQPITYRSPDGTEHIYDSIEDMPPELREMFNDLD